MFATYLFLAFIEVKQNEDCLTLPAEMLRCFESRSLNYLFIISKILKINLNKVKAEKLLDPRTDRIEWYLSFHFCLYIFAENPIPVNFS